MNVFKPAAGSEGPSAYGRLRPRGLGCRCGVEDGGDSVAFARCLAFDLFARRLGEALECRVGFREFDPGIDGGSRLIIHHSTNRSGAIYPYLICVGRHQKRTGCTMSAINIHDAERQIENLYKLIALTP